MKKLNTICFIFIITAVTACNLSGDYSGKSTRGDFGYIHPESDQKAIKLANAVINNMGGYETWEETSYIGWNFFGQRALLWDKPSGRVRIEYQKDSLTVIVNIHDESGVVFKNGKKVTNNDTLQKYLTKGHKTWVNDAYWLIMPFKLKDPGVILNYEGADTTRQGKPAEVIRLTFEEVGFTHNNMYKVYIDQKDTLVKQWAYYAHRDDEKAKMVTPWQDYKEYGNLLLSGNRGNNSLSNIVIHKSVPKGTFSGKEPPDIKPFK